MCAPTQDKENKQIRLIDTFQNNFANFEVENIIIGGDFNIPLDPKIDQKGGGSDLNKSMRYRTALSKFWALDLCDIWRLNNTNKHMFT